MTPRRVLTLMIGLLALGCTGEVEGTIGLLEPIRVVEGSFHDGELPSIGESGPRVVAIESASGLWLAGERDRLLVGRTTDDAHAIGVRFAELGSGWWTLPVQELDPIYPGERHFQFRFDVGGVIVPGNHQLALAAIDEQGRRGEITELGVCVRDPLLPDNLNPCDPSIPPPAWVIALSWDLDVDIDLVVETPSGKRISAKNPTGWSGEGEVPSEALADPSLGRLLRDSNAGCVIDGRNAEAVVGLEAPSETGTHLVRADLFDACGQSGALVRAVVWQRVEHEDGTWSLRETQRVDATMFDLQASGGAGTPLFLMAVDIED
jgi:hypothetical protein